MRYSHQRELILREVLSRSDHPTAEQICTSLRADCPRLSLGTVYRDLNTLVEIGKIRRVSIPGEADRFESKSDDHQHLYCRVCHKVESISIPDDKLEELVKACPGIKAEEFSLTVFGLCSECAAREQQS
ncbi:MAG: transcriptional repressor [Gemmiger sp.]|uniref:Fur family transcriptional regulator n=1 Tax=Gemmiger sp. TaxID=2049027 RepID=UPI002E768CB8|nr:transcriptional repressor [Gemmiger sp.]MEE0800182.1 transcriptional repressor [Gemmiger sp.]